MSHKFEGQYIDEYEDGVCCDCMMPQDVEIQKEDEWGYWEVCKYCNRPIFGSYHAYTEEERAKNEREEKWLTRQYNGQNILFHCTELINELKADVNEFGADHEIYVWIRQQDDIAIYVNYDFIVEDDFPISSEELAPNERIKIMKAGDLLTKLEQQNSLFKTK